MYRLPIYYQYRDNFRYQYISTSVSYCKNTYNQWWAKRRYKRRYFFGSGSGSVSAFFRHQRQAAAPLFFLTEEAAALQRCFLSEYSAAAATPNKLLPRLFWFTFSLNTAWSLYSPFVFTLLLLLRYFSFVEHTSRSADLCWTLGGIICNFTPILPYFQHWGDKPRPQVFFR